MLLAYVRRYICTQYLKEEKDAFLFFFHSCFACFCSPRLDLPLNAPHLSGRCIFCERRPCPDLTSYQDHILFCSLLASLFDAEGDDEDDAGEVAALSFLPLALSFLSSFFLSWWFSVLPPGDISAIVDGACIDNHIKWKNNKKYDLIFPASYRIDAVSFFLPFLLLARRRRPFLPFFLPCLLSCFIQCRIDVEWMSACIREWRKK